MVEYSHSIMGNALKRKKLNVPEEKSRSGTSESLPHVIVGD
jgi:hypothetical protein